MESDKKRILMRSVNEEFLKEEMKKIIDYTQDVSNVLNTRKTDNRIYLDEIEDSIDKLGSIKQYCLAVIDNDDIGKIAFSTFGK